MTSRVDRELVLYLDYRTGELDIGDITCNKPDGTNPDSVREFYSGLTYDDGVATRIRSALNKKGVKVKGVRGKCIDISKDWLVQILTVLYFGLDRNIPDRLAYLIKAANNNAEWKHNHGIELQKLAEKEYWDKVEQFEHAKRQKNPPAKQPARNGIKSLIIEDSIISRKVMSSYLSPLGECTHANNGTEAIKAFIKAVDEGKNYDLVTLDIMLPEIDGHEVLKRIRCIEEERGIDSAKIIMTTALDNAKVIMTAFKEQCDGYLVKPIRKKELMKRLSELHLLEQ